MKIIASSRRRLQLLSLVGPLIILSVACSGTDDGSPQTTDTTVAVTDSTSLSDTRMNLAAGSTSLAAGKYRSVTFGKPHFQMNFELPKEGLLVDMSEGALLIAADAEYSSTPIMFFDMGKTKVLPPTVTMEKMGDSQYVSSITSAAPDDVLAMLASRPGVTGGPVQSVDFGGVPARRQLLAFRITSELSTCGRADDATCHFLFIEPTGGIGYYQTLPNEGQLLAYEMTVADRRIVVLQDVTVNPDVADLIAKSVEFVTS